MFIATSYRQMWACFVKGRLGKPVDVKVWCRVWEFALKVLVVSMSVSDIGSFQQDVSCYNRFATCAFTIGHFDFDVLCFECSFDVWVGLPLDWIVSKAESDAKND